VYALHGFFIGAEQWTQEIHVPQTIEDAFAKGTRPMIVDAHYRTIPDRLSRGLVGHSMGGYGATRIGMRHPDVFGSLYIMSPCCLSFSKMKPMDAATEKAVRALKSPADSASLPWYVRPQLALAAAWSPDPRKPPLYLDLPYHGTHTSAVAYRVQNHVLPFFSRTLCFERCN